MKRAGGGSSRCFFFCFFFVVACFVLFVLCCFWGVVVIVVMFLDDGLFVCLFVFRMVGLKFHLNNICLQTPPLFDGVVAKSSTFTLRVGH